MISPNSERSAGRPLRRRRGWRTLLPLVLVAGALSGAPLPAAAQPLLEVEAPDTSRDPEMLQLVTFLDQRIQSEDPAASPENRRAALLDSLEMMGIAVPEAANQDTSLSLQALARELQTSGTPEQQEEREVQVEALVATFDIPPWIPPRTQDTRLAVADLAKRLRRGEDVDAAYRPRPRPVTGAFSARAADPDAGPEPGPSSTSGPGAAELLGPSPEDAPRAAPSLRLPPGVPAAHAPLPPPRSAAAPSSRSTGDGRSPLARRIEALRQKLEASSEG